MKCSQEHRQTGRRRDPVVYEGQACFCGAGEIVITIMISTSNHYVYVEDGAKAGRTEPFPTKAKLIIRPVFTGKVDFHIRVTGVHLHGTGFRLLTTGFLFIGKSLSSNQVMGETGFCFRGTGSYLGGAQTLRVVGFCLRESVLCSRRAGFCLRRIGFCLIEIWTRMSKMLSCVSRVRKIQKYFIDS